MQSLHFDDVETCCYSIRQRSTYWRYVGWFWFKRTRNGGATVSIGPVTTDSGLNGPTIGPETTEDKDKRERHERARAFALSFSSQ